MMHVNVEVVKKHWKPITAGVLGFLLLLWLLKRAAGGSAASSAPADLSGGASQVQAYSAAASLQNAQINGQVETAQLQAGVATNAIAAQLQGDLAKTAAELDATNHQTNAAIAIATVAAGRDVSIQQIQSTAAVQQTAIEGNTLNDLGALAAKVQMQRNTIVAGQINQIMAHSKHFQADIGAFAPVAAVESGAPQAAPALAGANAQVKIATSPAATINSIANVGKVFAGLFA
jgi:hypothetical protein